MMVSVTIRPDFQNSVIFSYFNLVFPVSSRVRCNKDFFDSYSLRDDEKESLISLLNSAGHRLFDMSDEKSINFFALEKILSPEYIDIPIDEIRMDTEQIRSNMLDYAAKYRLRFNDILDRTENADSLERYLSGMTSSILESANVNYNLSLEFSENIEYRLIDIIRPSACGRMHSGTFYIFHPFFKNSCRNESLLDGFIHECLGHKSVSHLKRKMRDIFGEKLLNPFELYAIEEGFVKSFTDVICSDLLDEKYHNPNYSQILEAKSHEIFESRQSELKEKPFDVWYLDIVREIRDSM